MLQENVQVKGKFVLLFALQIAVVSSTYVNRQNDKSGIYYQN